MLSAGVSSLAFAQASRPTEMLPAVQSVTNCGDLSSEVISKAVGVPVHITTAVVADSNRTPSFCKVNAVVDDYGKIEVHLPVSTWTQRFLAGGGPGGGAQAAGFATMSGQDVGNRGNEDVFADNYQFRINFGYRMVHLQVLTAKALISRFYNQPARFSYYNACSEPGREGMREVQRFPEDFDGAVTGCPPINFTINNGLFYAWNIRTNTRPDGKLIITPDKLPALHRAVLDECDAADGLKDGLISDPLACHPKLTKVECKTGEDSSACLTQEQIHVALELYRGAHDPQGDKLTPIGVLPGSELQWMAVIAPNPPQPGRPAFANDREGTVKALRSEFSDPALGTNWKLSDLVFDRASFDAFTKMRYLYDATDPNLSAFAKAGHKLILYQGLADTNVLPAHTILYYTALQQTMGEKSVNDFVRLYLLPGVRHCGGGDGPSIRDFLGPLQAWVEQGIAPGALPASHVPQTAGGGPGGMGGPGMGGPGMGGPGMGGPGMGGPGGPGNMGRPPAIPDRTRPIYPYPYTAKYTGTGDSKAAANFVAGPAHPAPATLFRWYGDTFYKSGYEKWCSAHGTTMTCHATRTADDLGGR